MRHFLKSISLATVLLGAGFSAQASPYLFDDSGNPLRNERGQCWRTVEWTPAAAIQECDPLHWAAAEKAKKKKKTKPLAPPAALATPASAVAALVVSEPATKEPEGPSYIEVEEIALQPLTLNSDTSFRFADHRLTSEARDILQGLAGVMLARRAKDITIRVTGHTDRIGATSANQSLGLKRAEAIKNTLIEMGLTEANIEVFSKGASEPITHVDDCPNDLVKCELINCLRPDRRVVIETRGKVEVKKKVLKPVEPKE